MASSAYLHGENLYCKHQPFTSPLLFFMRTSIQVLLCCTALILITGSCKKTDISSNHALPPVPDAGMYITEQYTSVQLTTFTNIAYSTRPNYNGIQYTSVINQPSEAGHPQLTMQMDIAVPPNATAAKKQPLIIIIHGGGFSGGSKEDFRDEALSYARAGYVAATINYRLTFNNKDDSLLRFIAITHATEDGMNAIRYLKANAGLYKIDTARIVTVGSSAGGGIALVNAVEFNTLAGTISDYNGISSKVAGAVSTGATLSNSSVPNGFSQLHFDRFDSPVLLMHSSGTDPVTGATWTNDVVATQNAINASGNSCTIVAQPAGLHVANVRVGGDYWNDEKKFLWEKLRLYELQ